MTSVAASAWTNGARCSGPGARTAEVKRSRAERGFFSAIGGLKCFLAKVSGRGRRFRWRP